VPEKNSLPSLVVHFCLRISSFSSASMRPHINARVASAQTEHSVPVKSQLIPNLPTELSPTKEMESNPMVNHPLPPMEREPPRRGVDASKVSKGIETLREGEGKSCG